MDIQGNGEFLVATNTEIGTIIFRNPDNTREDLIIPPRQGMVIEETWLKVPHFVRSADEGRISLKRSDKVPPVMRMEVAPEYDSQLTPGLKHLTVTIVSCPLEEGKLPPQYLSAIHVGKLVNDAGIPQSREVSVSPEYLQTTHMYFLKALRELETRYQNRPAVLNEVEKALDKIKALA